jgi:hypothetical protein
MTDLKWARCCAALLCALLASPAASASQLPTPPFRVNYLEGGPSTTNYVRSKRPVDIALQILDQDNNPVRNAEVTFIFPSVGASLTPTGGGTIVTARTDDDGRVRIAGLIPFGTGAVNIIIRIRAGAMVQTVNLTHNNIMGPFMTPAKWSAVLAGGAVAGAVTSILVVTRKDNSARITLGPASVGPR